MSATNNRLPLLVPLVGGVALVGVSAAGISLMNALRDSNGKYKAPTNESEKATLEERINRNRVIAIIGMAIATAVALYSFSPYFRRSYQVTHRNVPAPKSRASSSAGQSSIRGLVPNRVEEPLAESNLPAPQTISRPSALKEASPVVQEAAKIARGVEDAMYAANVAAAADLRRAVATSVANADRFPSG